MHLCLFTKHLSASAPYGCLTLEKVQNSCFMRERGMNCLLTILFAAYVLEPVVGFPKGGPVQTCSYLLPKHHHDIQTGPPPYQVITSTTSYSPNQTIEVTISAPGGGVFRGFMLGARRVNGDLEEVVGTFIDWPRDHAQGRTWYPQRDKDNCVTHTNNTNKIELKVKWQAPEKSVGDIIFTTSLVKSYKVYWYNVSSNIVRAATKSQDLTFPYLVNLTMSNMQVGEGCGEDRGCIIYPPMCSPSDCDIVLTYKMEEEYVQFAVVGRSPGYVSIGLSRDKMMGEDNTISCTMSPTGTRITMQHGYNPHYYNQRHRVTSLRNISIARIEDKIYCRFARPVVDNVTLYTSNTSMPPETKSYDLRKQWYVMIAVGELYTGTDVVAKHTSLPLITTKRVNFSAIEIEAVTVLPLLIQVHGSVMLVAWMALASIGMVTAEYLKPVFGSMCNNLKVWFQIHRTLMALVYCLTVTGIILVFVYLKKWVQEATVHGAVGLAAMFLATLQVIMALLRPDVNDERRKYFNWAHRCGGYITHILAGASFILAFNISLMTSTLRRLGLIVVIIWLVFDYAWNAVFCIVQSCYKVETKYIAQGPDGQFEIQEGHDRSLNQSNAGPTILKIAYVIYIITTLVLTTICITFLFIF